jgi:anti-anti-sigma regulatory factor
MPASISRILVGLIGPVFWMRVDGKGTHLNSLQAKTAFTGMIGRGVHQLVIDLERCPMMDSTFLGMLTGTALGVKEACATGTLCVLNANARNIQLLTSLGLNHILEIDEDGKLWSAERERASAALKLCEETEPCSKEDQTQHVLSAHQILSGISSDNECRFRDVIDFLEKELHAHIAEAVPG